MAVLNYSSTINSKIGGAVTGIGRHRESVESKLEEPESTAVTDEWYQPAKHFPKLIWLDHKANLVRAVGHSSMAPKQCGILDKEARLVRRSYDDQGNYHFGLQLSFSLREKKNLSLSLSLSRNTKNFSHQELLRIFQLKKSVFKTPLWEFLTF